MTTRMARFLVLILIVGLFGAHAFGQSTLVPNGNRLWINASADHKLAIVVGYRVRQVTQGQATATVKTYDIGKPSTTSTTDVRFYVCDSTATTCSAAANIVKLTEGFCQGVSPAKYGFVVDVLLSTGVVVTGPLSSKGIDCGTVAMASVQDVYRVQ